MNHCLQPPDPIVLHYTIKPNEPPPVAPQAWDVEVKTEDSSLKSKMNQVVLSMSNDSARELASLDDQVRFFIPIPLDRKNPSMVPKRIRFADLV